MAHYETLMLLRTEATNDEFAALEQQLETLASESGGSSISFDRWGKYRLAYPIKKCDYGVYTLARYEVPLEKAKQLNDDFDMFIKIKSNDAVLRHVTIRLDHDGSREYGKPEPIDSGGQRNLDTFIRENRMEGIIGTDVKAPTSSAQVEKKPEAVSSPSAKSTADLREASDKETTPEGE